MTEVTPAEDIFFAALRRPPESRAAFLDTACRGDTALRDRIERMLAAEPELGEFLARTQANGAVVLDRPAVTAPGAEAGAVIAGRYRLARQIGEGGMGAVWLADQLEPVRRQVAVKLIRAAHGGSGEILARFAAERQAIALMDHPHIARLLDAGTTGVAEAASVGAGRPYFVMELVNGVPLDEYCDRHRLTVPARLGLFMQVCAAVQHAHQKGVIHRDLKPGNVLVEDRDGGPVPRVIDFGLAKAVGGLRLTEHPLTTRLGSVAGTPLYMAPEQTTPDAVDVDTRADVYALGVILYELLTGTTPIGYDEAKRAAFDELLRTIREGEPPTPSRRLSAVAPAAAAARQTEPAKLVRLVRGDLDWIAMKALAKERDRRYESAAGLAADVGRFLRHEPVLAGPPGAAYRARKFVRRNRPQVAAAGLLLLALLAGIAGTTFGLIRADERQQAAEGAQLREAEQRRAAEVAAEAAGRAAAEERQARQREATERKYARAIADFIRNDFFAITSLDGRLRFSGDGLDRHSTLLDVLNRAATKLKGRTDLDPRTEAELSWIIGVNYRGAGEPNKGLPFLERAVAVRRSALGPDAPETLNAQNSLGVCYRSAGQNDKALPLLEDTHRRQKATLGPDDPATITTLHNLADSCADAGQRTRALELYEEAFALSQAKRGRDDQQTLRIMNNMGIEYSKAGNGERALQLFEEAHTRKKATLPPDHPDLLTGIHNLAAGYQGLRQYGRALKLHKEAFDLRTAALGPDDPDTLFSMNSLAHSYRSIGDHDRSLALFKDLLRIQQRKWGRHDPAALATVVAISDTCFLAGRLAEAIPYLEEAYTAPKTNPSQRAIASGLVVAYTRSPAPVRYTDLTRDLLAEVRRNRPADSPQLGHLLAKLGASRLREEAWADAEALLRECLAIREKTEPGVWPTANTRSMLGGALLGQKKYADAGPLLLKGYEGLKQREKAIPPQSAALIPEALDRLIAWSDATGESDGAKAWRAERAKYPSPREVAPPPRPKG